MENPTDDGQDQAPEKKSDFKRFATKRIAVGVLLALVTLWVVSTVAGWFSAPHQETPQLAHTAADAGHGTTPSGHAPAAPAAHDTGGQAPAAPAVHDTGGHAPAALAAHDTGGHVPTASAAADTAAAGHGAAGDAGHAAPLPAPKAKRHPTQPAMGFTSAEGHTSAAVEEHGASAAAGHAPASEAASVKGVAFVEAVIRPLAYELDERFWGWRPNDILNFTDNVNSYQLGVIEVTRRTAVILAERISRAGSTEAFDKNLENAMNWFMVSADRYWFPSPEGKYKDALVELQSYKERLLRGQARFWTRTDNVIPLLMAYEDLLGSCDENLVKAREDDGTEVSFFAADDYFFYAKGVASALYEILHAIEKDFYPTIEARRGMEVLHHAIESCHHAMEIDPIIITNSSLSGILANHRANMAAPISHARFYLTVLIKTLST